MKQLGILSSSRGTSMLSIIHAIEQAQLAAQIAIVVTNKSNAMVIAKAQLHGIPACFINPSGLSREDYDLQVDRLLHDFNVDLVVLVGYLRILSNPFIHQWRNKIINVHPSLLPAHAGKMDLAVHESVLAAKEKITGCSVHYVTEDIDAGPIILTKNCPVYEGDTAAELKSRVQALEGPALVEAIALHCQKF